MATEPTPNPESPLNPARRPDPRLRHILLLGALVLAATAFAATLRPPGTDQVAWQTDLTAARKQSAQTGKPVLMYFWATWCPGCKAMGSYVFGEESIAADIMDQTIPVKIDLTHTTEANAPLAWKYRAEMLPVLVLTDADGQELARYASGAWPDQFSPWLAEHSRGHPPATPPATPIATSR